MEIRLAADFGNTRVKAALFRDNELLLSKIYPTAQEFVADKDFYSAARRAIVCSVTGDHAEAVTLLQSKIQTLLFASDTKVPLKNLYRSASTLGSDRLAASIGAFTLFPDRNVLTIDAGTCIKYNFVNERNEFIGGAISPGILMRLKAMHHFTSRLPLPEAEMNYDKLTGSDTRESLLSGSLTGAVSEVEGMISRYEKTYPNVKVVFTGGDSDYLCKQLKNRFFAHPSLLLLGLNRILEFNIEK